MHRSYHVICTHKILIVAILFVRFYSSYSQEIKHIIRFKSNEHHCYRCSSCSSNFITMQCNVVSFSTWIGWNITAHHIPRHWRTNYFGLYRMWNISYMVKMWRYAKRSIKHDAGWEKRKIKTHRNDYACYKIVLKPDVALVTFVLAWIVQRDTRCRHIPPHHIT